MPRSRISPRRWRSIGSWAAFGFFGRPAQAEAGIQQRAPGDPRTRKRRQGDVAMKWTEPRPSEGEKKSGCWQAKACPTTATRVPAMVGHAFASIVLFSLAAAGLLI